MSSGKREKNKRKKCIRKTRERKEKHESNNSKRGTENNKKKFSNAVARINEPCELVKTWFRPAYLPASKAIREIYCRCRELICRCNSHIGLNDSIWIPKMSEKKPFQSNYEFRFRYHEKPVAINDRQHTIVYLVSNGIAMRMGWGAWFAGWTLYYARISLGGKFTFNFWRNDDWLWLRLVACIAYMRYTCTRPFRRDFPLVIKGCVNNGKRKKF